MQRRVEELTRKLEAARASKLRERNRTTAASMSLPRLIGFGHGAVGAVSRAGGPSAF